MSLQIIITDAGRAEVVNAENNGTAPVVLSEVGFGTGKYTATADQTSLQSEFKRLNTISGASVGDDIIHISASDEGSGAYSVNEIGVYTQSGTLFAVYSQNASIIDKSAVSIALLSIDIAIQSLNPDSVTFGDANFIYPPATTEAKGTVELATNSEVQTGTDSSRAVTAASLSARTATTTRTGLVELATDAETQAGNDTNRAVTPSSLKARTATTDRTGLVELATNSETQSGTDSSRAVTPASLSSRTATESRTGLTRYATSSEAQSGSSTSSVMTPARALQLLNKYGIGGEAPDLPGNNLNITDNSMKTGIYEVAAATTGNPSGNSGSVLWVRTLPGGGEFQLLMLSGGSGDMYFRRRFTGSWDDWQRLFHTGNQGAGSGLDADKVDGLHAGQFLRSDNTTYFQNGAGGFRITGAVGRGYLQGIDGNGNNGQVYITGLGGAPAERIELIGPTFMSGKVMFAGSGNHNNQGPNITLALGDADTGFNWNGDGDFDLMANNHVMANVTSSRINFTKQLYLNGNPIWNATNDGSGSGLDADKLDGQHGNYYLNATNLNSGQVPSARLPTATTGSRGALEVATPTEVSQGASNDKAVTPSGLRQAGYYSEDNNEMIGVIGYFATTVAPDGWIKANGAAVSRAAYSKLYSKVGTFWGNGNGSSTFNLPDLRGEFIRSWSDGRGVDSGRSFGSVQGDQVGSHRHSLPSDSNDASGNGYVGDSNGSGTARSAYTGYAGGNETRPRNVALVAYIKY